jgi:hypothetical protein
MFHRFYVDLIHKIKGINTVSDVSCIDIKEELMNESKKELQKLFDRRRPQIVGIWYEFISFMITFQ